MMKFDDKYFNDFNFSKEQIKKNFANALKDLKISKKDKIAEVKFNYAYMALIKTGIALASFYGKKVKSAPGHHVKIIETIAQALGDESVNEIGNVMRSKRNTDFYGGGVDITEKESKEYSEFVEKIIKRIEEVILR